MKLSFRFLNDVQSVNSFEAAVSASISEGSTQDLYIQLIDVSVDRIDQGYSPAGRRYIPLADSTMTCTFTNTNTGPSTGLDDSMAPRVNPALPVGFVRTASQPFDMDGSIWKIPLLATDPLSGTVNMKLILNDGGDSTHIFNISGPGLVLRAC